MSKEIQRRCAKQRIEQLKMTWNIKKTRQALILSSLGLNTYLQRRRYSLKRYRFYFFYFIITKNKARRYRIHSECAAHNSSEMPWQQFGFVFRLHINLCWSGNRQVVSLYTSWTSVVTFPQLKESNTWLTCLDSNQEPWCTGQLASPPAALICAQSMIFQHKCYLL